MIGKTLILSPHIDDAELGCGGVIAKYGADVMVFSYCDASMGGDDNPRSEFNDSMKILDCSYTDYKFPVRRFNEYRQDILEILYNVRGEYDTVFCPCSADKHQDHQTIRTEAERAFPCTILGYELPWNTKEFRQDIFVSLTKEHVGKKLEALSCYKSQQKRPYFSSDFIRGLASVRGVQAGTKYAEAFEVIRYVL